MQVYINGSYTDHSRAVIPVDDRGFLFADGVYEVIRVYNGRPFLLEPHMQRLYAGLDALRISHRGVDVIGDVAQKLIDDNGVTGDGTVYVQVTRGCAPRKHAFPKPEVAPTVYVVARPFQNHPDRMFEQGVRAVTVPDTRWSRCDIKAIALLPNVLANQQAHDADAFEALFIRDGVIIEGSHSNLFGVVDDRLVTYPSCNYILTGITRNLLLDLARDLGIPTAEAPIYTDRADRIQELFLSGTTTEVMPVTQLDGRPVGNGTRGPVTERLQRAFREKVAELTASVGV